MIINAVQATPYQTNQDTDASQDNLPYATQAAMPHAVQIMAGVEMVIVGATATTTTTTESPKFTRTMSISTRPIRK